MPGIVNRSEFNRVPARGCSFPIAISIEGGYLSIVNSVDDYLWDAQREEFNGRSVEVCARCASTLNINQLCDSSVATHGTPRVEMLRIADASNAHHGPDGEGLPNPKRA